MKLMDRPSKATRNVGYLASFYDFDHMTEDELRAAAIERARKAGHREFGEITFVVHELSYNTTAFGADPEQFRSRVLVATVEVIA